VFRTGTDHNFAGQLTADELNNLTTFLRALPSVSDQWAVIRPLTIFRAHHYDGNGIIRFDGCRHNDISLQKETQWESQKLQSPSFLGPNCFIYPLLDKPLRLIATSSRKSLSAAACGLDRKKKPLHARTRQIIRCPYRCLSALIFSTIQ